MAAEAVVLAEDLPRMFFAGDLPRAAVGMSLAVLTVPNLPAGLPMCAPVIRTALPMSLVNQSIVPVMFPAASALHALIMTVRSLIGWWISSR